MSLWHVRLKWATVKADAPAHREDFKFLRVFYVIELGLTTSSCKEGGNSEFGLSDNFGPCMRPLPMSLSGSLCAFWIRGLLKIGRTM